MRAHCKRTAGTCIKDHLEEKEGGNIKQHVRMKQQGIRVLRMTILAWRCSLWTGWCGIVGEQNLFASEIVASVAVALLSSRVY